MGVSNICCPECKAHSLKIGKIPPSNLFAGRVLHYSLSGFFLYRCENCGLGFKWPQLAKHELDELYRQGSELTWVEHFENRTDWIVSHKWIKKLIPAGGSILDVGTFDGAFLEPLLSSYNCSGIEIHPASINKASERGVKIIAKDFSAISGSYDFITAFDVIEHMLSPAIFIKDCMRSLRQGGYLVISTGNLDATTARLMGSKYWYFSFPEHVSFISPRWMNFKSSFDGFEIKKVKFFSHSKSLFPQSLIEIFKNGLYYVSPKTFSWLRQKVIGNGAFSINPNFAAPPPSWITSRDHVIFLLKKT